MTGESPQKGPITRKMFPFDDVIINTVKGSVTRTFLLCVLSFKATWAQSQSQSDEHRLILSLTNPDTYDKRVRPGNVSDTVNVKFGLDLFDLIDVVCMHNRARVTAVRWLLSFIGNNI